MINEISVTPKQRELIRHALGLPNDRNESYRNHFCAGLGHDDWKDWLDMVARGLAVRRESGNWGGDSMFHVKLETALFVREPHEHLSPEDVPMMRLL
jgi:hypothetical protein